MALPESQPTPRPTSSPDTRNNPPRQTFSRRRFLGGIAGGVAAAVVGGVLTEPSPAFAHGIDHNQTRVKTQRSTATASGERTAAEVRSSIVDEMETWGHEQALTDTEMKQLIENLNAQVSARSPEERAATMRNDTYYGTMFISETAYRAFFTDNGETFQTFLKRHEIEMRRMLKDAQPSIVPDMMDERTDTRGFQIRRVIVLRDMVESPASNHAGYLINGIKDSDGTWHIRERYTPRERSFSTGRGYYDEVKQIDYGLLHEWGHQKLHLNDQYALEVKPTGIPTPIKNRLPTFWQEYYVEKRFDLGGGHALMIQGNGIGNDIQTYASWQLARRRNPHNLEMSLKDQRSWPYELAQRVVMNFRLINGQAIIPDAVEIYRTKGTGNGYEKALMEIPVYTGNLRNLNPSLLFEANQDGTIVDTGATLLVKINSNGQTYFRWMDVRDFNLAYWTTGNAGVVAMDMKVIATDDTTTTPESFDWTIRSSTKRSLVPMIPRLFTGLSN